MRRCVNLEKRAAVFLDRDGVLVEDQGILTRSSELKLLSGVAQALCALKQAHYKLIVITNQAVVARGLLTEAEVEAVNMHLDRMLQEEGAPSLDGYFFCPHHPSATLLEYRMACNCRKPAPGMLLKAAWEHDIDLSSSYMVGDRLTDIVAGHRAGCRTVLVETGQHLAPSIETNAPFDLAMEPTARCGALDEAARWILGQS